MVFDRFQASKSALVSRASPLWVGGAGAAKSISGRGFVNFCIELPSTNPAYAPARLPVRGAMACMI